MNQIKLHKKIDALLLKGHINEEEKNVSALISANEDTRQYFYTKANEDWLDWLWKNGFLDVIKKKAGDPTRYGYAIPELGYLARVSEKVPAKVVDIMLAIPVSAETFNPEVIDRFLRICSVLPVEQLVRMVQKIHDEGWAPLMGAFNQFGFEYEEMLKTLADAKDYGSVLVLSRTILTVRTKEEIEKLRGRITMDNPFYFDDLSYIKVFEHMTSLDVDYAEQALELVTKVMSEVVLLGAKEESGEVFKIEGAFHLFDIDLFTLEPGQKEHLSHRNDIRELVAVIKVLVSQLIGGMCDKPKITRVIYEKYIQSLPDSRAMWRLRLFVLSLCPTVFKGDLKMAFFRLFRVERRYHEIISGAEYEKALQKGFSVLDERDQRQYIKQVIEYFSKHAKDKEDQKWHKIYGSRILSMIVKQLTREERQQVEKERFEIYPDYKPEPSIGQTYSGSISSRGPISQEEFGKLSMTEIAKNLRTKWVPKELSKQNTSDDFLNPLNAEGVAELLWTDIPSRIQDYVDNANLFFERGVLDQHYTYSFLRGIDEALRGGKIDISGMNWENLINLFTVIKNFGEKEQFDHGKRERDSFDVWLVGWIGVHSMIADVIRELLNKKEEGVSVNFLKYRDAFLGVIGYLLADSDPKPEDEEPETVTMKSNVAGSNEMLVRDPFSMAINTVRGRAFQVFVLFVYEDGKKFSKEDSIKIESDVKGLYEKVLQKEDTRALMFMFGHYLPTFYFRDIKWIKKLLLQIFPENIDKKHLYLAAWEGYLASNLYKEMFHDSDFQQLYERGLALTGTEDSKRKYYKDPDTGIATHFALAFMYHKEFGFSHPLFKVFWNNNDSKRHATFVSFLGRMFVSGDNAQANELLAKESRSKQRLKDLWDWVLENSKDPDLFVEFGFWISLEKSLFEPVWLAGHVKNTLKKTKGKLNFDYGLMKYIVQLAEEASEDTLAITRLYLLEGGVRGDNSRALFHIDEEWFQALKILYSNPKTKSGTYTLIDDLVREGGRAFWGFKKILDGS